MRRIVTLIHYISYSKQVEFNFGNKKMMSEMKPMLFREAGSLCAFTAQHREKPTF